MVALPFPSSVWVVLSLSFLSHLGDVPWLPPSCGAVFLALLSGSVAVSLSHVGAVFPSYFLGVVVFLLLLWVVLFSSSLSCGWCCFSLLLLCGVACFLHHWVLLLLCGGYSGDDCRSKSKGNVRFKNADKIHLNRKLKR